MPTELRLKDRANGSFSRKLSWVAFEVAFEETSGKRLRLIRD
jgi:hypothetical protein